MNRKLNVYTFPAKGNRFSKLSINYLISEEIMKKSVVFLLVVISLFACVSTVFAKDASEMIGTITSYVEEIQGYPEALRDACGTDMFKQN
jgi:hypothetical protein